MLRLQNQLISLLRSGSASTLLSCTITPLRRHSSATASTSPFPAEEYLVTACGLTRAQALKASKGLSHLRSPSNPDAVLAFLSGLGLSGSDIAAVVSGDPKLLCSNVDETLAPRVARLRGLGLSRPQIARFVLIGAPVLRTCDVASRLPFWIPLFGSFDEFAQAVSRGGLGGAAILRRDIDTVVKPNVLLLLECGVTVHDLAKTGLGGLWALVCKPDKLKELIARAEEELGVRRGSGQFAYALATVSSLSQENIASKMKLLKKTLGCSDDLLQAAIVKHPSLLRASEDNLRSTVEFLITEVRLEPEYIVGRPSLIGFSLKGRLMPRYIVLKILQDRGLSSPKFSSLINASERYFVSRYIDCYKESVPELADAYAAARAGKTPSQLNLDMFWGC